MFPARVGDFERGDDGGIGYFTAGADGACTDFNAVQDTTWSPGSYVASIGPEPAGTNYLPPNFGTGNACVAKIIFERGSLLSVSR
jgi:hypothetical protein